MSEKQQTENTRHETQCLLENEVWDERVMYYAPGAVRSYASPEDIARALSRPAGRFRSPLSWRERALLWLTAAVPRFDPLRLGEHLIAPVKSVAPDYPWQVLVRYLVREGVLVSAEAWRASFAHDEPKMVTVRLPLKLGSGDNLTGTGNSPDFETAYSKAIGEGLERFILASTKRYRLRVAQVASIAQLWHQKKVFLNPESITQFSPEQRERDTTLDFDRETLWSWVIGTRLSDHRRTLLPAQSVSFNRFRSRGKSEPFLREQNTNAAAGGFTLTEALVSGIREAIERDGFLIYWLNSIAPPVIDTVHCVDEELQTLLATVQRYQLEPVFLNTTTDLGVPSCVCIIIDRGTGGPSVVLGGGSGFDIAQMLKTSLFEALSVHRGREVPDDPIELGEAYQPFIDGSIDLSRRIRFWKNPESFSRIEFFLRGKKQSLAEAFPGVRTFDTPTAELAALEQRLRTLGTGYEVYYYEHRYRILEKIGYHVVKVIIPELVHLYLYEHRASLGATRLKTVPTKLGYETAQEWNPWPHPFP